LHDFEAANALLARWKVIGIMIPVLAGIWNRIRAHPLQEKVDHLDKRFDEGIKEISQRFDEGIKEISQRFDEGIKEINQIVQKMESLAALIEQSTEVEKDDKADQPS